MSTLSRRDVIQRVTAFLGGAALVGGDSLAAFTFDDAARSEVMAQGVGSFTVADVALLDEIAETILPETSTPGAKAAKTGAFIALMVTDTYTVRSQDVFREGLRKLNEACSRDHGVDFMTATAAQRRLLAEALDREQKEVMDARLAPPTNRAPVAAAAIANMAAVTRERFPSARRQRHCRWRTIRENSSSGSLGKATRCRSARTSPGSIRASSISFPRKPPTCNAA